MKLVLSELHKWKKGRRPKFNRILDKLHSDLQRAVDDHDMQLEEHTRNEYFKVVLQQEQYFINVIKILCMVFLMIIMFSARILRTSKHHCFNISFICSPKKMFSSIYGHILRCLKLTSLGMTIFVNYLLLTKLKMLGKV